MEEEKLEDKDHFPTKTPLTSSSSEPVSSCQSSFSPDHHHSPSFTSAGKNHKKKLQRKSASFAYRIREHVRLGDEFSETVKGKLSIGAKIIKKGGRENIFREVFGASDGEKLLKASQCYISTTVGPIAGILFVSTQKIAFCSERSIHVHSSGGLIRAPYKVLIPLKKIKGAHQSENVSNPLQQYIQIVTKDTYEFWFMGFVRYEKAWFNLQRAISLST